MKFNEYMRSPVNSTYAFTSEELEDIKKRVDIDKVLSTLDNVMEIPYQNVVEAKKIISTDPHDYESYSLYTWPDPNKDDGLPYIKRDGYMNPEHLKGNKLALRTMSYATYFLAIAYFVTEDKRYYERLKKHLYSFFLDKETRMNPNLNHGQAYPGRNDGQRGGIIDFAITFGYTITILNALRKKKLLESELVLGMQGWLREFKAWLLTHPFGHEMDIQVNNHCCCYDYIILAISLFIDDEDGISLIKNRYDDRIESQIDSDGFMEWEITRKTSRSYVFMNTKLLIEIGKLLGYKLCDNKYLVAAINLYLSHDSERLWPYEQVQPFDEEFDNYIYYMANRYFNIKNVRLKRSQTVQYALFENMLR